MNSGYQALFSPITECLGTRLALAKIRVLEAKLSSTHFCIERFMDSDEDLIYYTTYQTFALLWEYLGDRVNTLSH